MPTDFTKEGMVINRIMEVRTFQLNKNLICVVTGGTGSGKSWTCLRIAELWYKYKFKKDFPIENCCFTIDEMLARLSSGQVLKGDLLILEEAGTSMGALDFNTKVSRMFNYVLQAFRSKNIILFVNLPYMTMLNKTMRMLCHMKIEMMSINKSQGYSIVKPMHIQVSQQTGKIYNHFPKVLINHSWEQMKYMCYKTPSKQLVDAYEKKKDDFVNGLTTNVQNSLMKLNLEASRKIQPIRLCSEKQEILWKILQEHPGEFNLSELARYVKRRAGCISNSLEGMRKKGYNIDKYLRKSHSRVYQENEHLFLTNKSDCN